MAHLIKIDIDSSYDNSDFETEVVTFTFLDLYGNYELMRADHTFFKDSDDLLDYLEHKSGNLKLRVTEFSKDLKELLDGLEWKLI